MEIARSEYDGGGSGLEYQQLRLWLHKQGYNSHMAYCRKIFATFMRQRAGVESEIIDILQVEVQARFLQNIIFDHPV